MSTRSPSPARPRWESGSQPRWPGPARSLTLELGGKAAHVIFDDAPIDQAIEGVINGIFFNQGHVCCAGSRLFVQESIHDRFVEKLKRRLSTLAGGRPARQEHRRRSDQLGRAARTHQRARRGRARRKGRRCSSPTACFPATASGSVPRFSPGSRSRHRIAQEEIFGPVLSIMSFRTPDEAVEKANNTPYGLSAGVWT